MSLMLASSFFLYIVYYSNQLSIYCSYVRTFLVQAPLSSFLEVIAPMYYIRKILGLNSNLFLTWHTFLQLDFTA
jgi:hypothetical protein